MIEVSFSRFSKGKDCDMKLLKNSSSKPFTSSYVDQKFPNFHLVSLLHTLGSMLLVLFLLSACNTPGISPTVKKQASVPLPKILGSGTLVNNTTLFTGTSGTREGFGMHMITAQIGWGMRPQN